MKKCIGNSRAGRLIMFRESLRFGYVLFIITDELKIFYYNELRNWSTIKVDLMDICHSAQDNFKILLDKIQNQIYRLKCIIVEEPVLNGMNDKTFEAIFHYD